jgi:hypothetical protein
MCYLAPTDGTCKSLCVYVHCILLLQLIELPPAVAAHDPCGNSRCGTYKHAAGAGFDNRRFDGQVAASSIECYLRLVWIWLSVA